MDDIISATIEKCPVVKLILVFQTEINSGRQSGEVVKALALRLEKKGKEKMLVIGAAMRKLLQLAYGVLKSGQLFDTHYATKMQAAI